MQYHIFVNTPIRKAVSFYPGAPLFLVSGQMFWVSVLVTAYCICCAIWFWPDVLPFTFVRLVLLSVHSPVTVHTSVAVSVSWSVHLCTALYPVPYPGLVLIWSGLLYLVCSCSGCCSSWSCILALVQFPVYSITNLTRWVFDIICVTKTEYMKHLQKPNAKRNSSAFLMAIAVPVLVFGAVQITGPQFEAGMIVMILGGLCMLLGMLTLQD